MLKKEIRKSSHKKVSVQIVEDECCPARKLETDNIVNATEKGGEGGGREVKLSLPPEITRDRCQSHCSTGITGIMSQLSSLEKILTKRICQCSSTFPFLSLVVDFYAHLDSFQTYI